MFEFALESRKVRIFNAVNDIPSQLDIVVGKFANLRFIHAEQFFLFGSTKTKARDPAGVSQEQFDTGTTRTS